ncbi:hypothetical protein AtNW77_Chr5g0138271 [Arabidopsis thaliana]|uniref:KIB1-4 beta-propeller domain-containing protein n=5 Tax=Arabidopsis TaxID=3701 RepID=A0A178US14_ARATH|nr:hypothetical protein (DUF295) [Arabidopsis thaliana]KAG7605909.1 hypothetical protein ISN45_At05g048800 [Arabidopsis thaliana x Arabidopsis arenosa]KAG7612830.1 hypothetical protein ISN44_As05g048090 [Arabidopsis suecica]ABE65580.1 hypothetical protein At5g53230 [Arabidopsis thaliana]AED96327.1 hypothetical protein (DUF295) [Arabidopsis thaliana]OAO95702.1 hypothetical protein AXX17_AT5G52190 [Arabidopsis thaliana]|eukprot:NP_200135.1 hypothetical protein (DUF295) [Arabidopsis thaliana]
MSLLLNQHWKLCFRKPVLARSSPLHSNGLSFSSLQTPPCFIVDAEPCGAGLGKLKIVSAGDFRLTQLEKKVPLELMTGMENIGSSNGWVATLKDDVVRLQDDLNPFASASDPKRISLPPLVTLPLCQTQIVINVAMSSSSPEDDDCVVAVKFFGRQLSFFRTNTHEWINVKMEDPCFFSSRVFFSKKDDKFYIPGGHLIGSWDLRTDKPTAPKIHKLRFRNLPKLTKTKRKLMDSCYKREDLVESTTTGETFLVKWYKKIVGKVIKGRATIKTKAIMVFKLDEEGNAVYTQDIGDLFIFISEAQPTCVPASSVPGLLPNFVLFYDVNEFGSAYLADSSVSSEISTFPVPYHIPPQNIV